MNIFAVHADPEVAARSLCDRHVVKMTLETAQILCTVAWQHGHAPPYRATHAAHPCVKWAGARRANWTWLLRHGLALAAEYQRRFGRTHGSLAALRWVRDHDAGPPPSPARRQPFVQAMPAPYRGPDPVAAYRRYYAAEKAGFATWRPPARAPRWWPLAPRGPDSDRLPRT